jgi:hypothetical protein
MRCRFNPWLAAATVILVSGAAWAGERADAGSEDFGSPIAQEALNEHRGGQTTLQLNLQETESTVRHNAAINTVNGANYITDGSIRDSSGIISVIQNTGNNVSIQVPTTLNLTVQ